MSLREIASVTKIGMRFLQALEDDRLDILPGGLFPRAFVRQYARHLGLDVQATLDEFLRLNSHNLAEKPTPKPAIRAPLFRNRAWSGRLGLAASLTLIVAALFIGGRRGAGPERPPAPIPASLSAPVSVYPPPAPPASDLQDLTLTLTARQDCWVEIRVDGEIVLNRVLAVGETKTLEAAEEIRLSVGNAGGLALSVNNNPGVPLGRDGEVKRDILINHESASSFVRDGRSSVSG